MPRLSGVSDILPVVAEERILKETDLSQGSQITVIGQIRSHNVRNDGQRHLLIFVFPSKILCEDGEAVNEVLLERGTLPGTYLPPHPSWAGNL